jgi:hypothetical protein
MNDQRGSFPAVVVDRAKEMSGFHLKQARGCSHKGATAASSWMEGAMHPQAGRREETKR